VIVPALKDNKIGDVKDSFYGELERVFDKFPKYRKKICYDISMLKLVGRIFSNQPLGKSVYTKLETIMELE
jgi:hypothetical protein